MTRLNFKSGVLILIMASTGGGSGCSPFIAAPVATTGSSSNSTNNTGNSTNTGSNNNAGGSSTSSAGAAANPACQASASSSSNGFQAGTGSSASPYIICTAAQLGIMNSYCNSNSSCASTYFQLGQNIDLTSTTPTPIDAFNGTLDGQNYTISNYSYTAATPVSPSTCNGTTIVLNGSALPGFYTGAPTLATPTDAVGFIRQLNGTVKNINFSNFTLVGGYITGGIAAIFSGGTISNSNISGTSSVTGVWGVNSNGATGGYPNCFPSGDGPSGETGGIVGFMYQGAITGVYSNAVVSGNMHVGGLVGSAATMGNGTTQNSGSGISIANSGATGNVSGNDTQVGGLVGVMFGSITHCYATGNVTSSYSYVGGLVGDMRGAVSTSYATGNVSGSSVAAGIGGLLGELDMSHTTTTSITVQNSYATGTVSNARATSPFAQYNGGLIGISNSAGGTLALSNSYYAGANTSTTDAAMVGTIAGSISCSGLFYDNSLTSVGCTHSGSCTCTGGNTSTMQAAATFTGASWDFTSTWSIASGYPFLQ